MKFILPAFHERWSDSAKFLIKKRILCLDYMDMKNTKLEYILDFINDDGSHHKLLANPFVTDEWLTSDEFKYIERKNHKKYDGFVVDYKIDLWIYTEPHTNNEYMIWKTVTT